MGAETVSNDKITNILTMKVRSFLLGLGAALACSTSLYAWDATERATCEALAARTEKGFEDMLRYEERHYSQFNYKGWELWQIEMPKLLRYVARSGDVNACSGGGFSALQAACYYADVALAEALLRNGADVNMRPMGWKGYGFPGDTPIALLVRGMTPETAAARVQIARMLMEQGANPDADMMNWVWGGSAPVTPFCYLTPDAYNNDMRMALIDGGSKDLSSRTRTWDFTWHAYTPELIRTLLEAGISPNRSVGDKGETLLLHLVMRGDTELVKLALEKKADVKSSMLQQRNYGGYLFAIPAGKDASPEVAVQLARLLIEAKADVKAKFNGKSLYRFYKDMNTPAGKALMSEFAARGVRF